MSLPQSDELKDPALVAEVDLARAAAQEEAGDEEVGAHVDTQIEGDAAVTHLFEASKPGYRGWRWAATISSAGPATDVTVSEVVLLPGPDALVAPDWIPWEHRVQAGDLGVGDLLPTAPDDYRLVPGYVESDDPAVEAVALEAGLGRPRVMARPAREEAASRWQDSEYGPRADMARSAPAHCGTCGFYLQLAGSLGAAFGTCGNEYAPADGHVVHAEYGCGAHSEAEVEQISPVLVANLIYDDALLDVDPLPSSRVAATPAEPTSEATAEAPPAAPIDEATATEASAPAEAAPTAEATTRTEAVTSAEPTEPATTSTEAEAIGATAPAEASGEAATPTDEATTDEAATHVEPATRTDPAEATVTEPAQRTSEATSPTEPAEATSTEPDTEPDTESGPAEATATPPAERTSEASTGAAAPAEATTVGPAEIVGEPSDLDSTVPAEEPTAGPAEAGQAESSPPQAPPHSEAVAPLEPLVSTETSLPDVEKKTVGWSGWRAWTAKRQEDDPTEPEG